MKEKEMIKGFNDGYLLQQHKPELADALQQGFEDKNHPYSKSFSQGRIEFQRTQDKSKTQSNSYQDYLKAKGLGTNHDLGKEHHKNKDKDKGKSI